MHDRCKVCAERTIGSDIILGATDGTPTRRASSGNLFRSIWRYYLSLSKIGARFALTVPKAHTPFWTHLIVLLGDVGQEEARSVPFGDSVKLSAR
jgi:hypothetical protein